MKLCVLDFETANQHPASACSLGLLVIEEGMVIHEWSSLIQPHPAYDTFDPMNTLIHGIKKDDVCQAPEFITVYPELLALMEDTVLMAHNAMFDMTVLKALMHVYGLSIPNLPYIDSLEVARKMYPQLRNHKLNTVCEYLSIQLNHHDALSDAKGSALIAMNTMADMQEFDVERWMKRLNLKIRTL